MESLGFAKDKRTGDLAADARDNSDEGFLEENLRERSPAAPWPKSAGTLWQVRSEDEHTLTSAGRQATGSPLKDDSNGRESR